MKEEEDEGGRRKEKEEGEADDDEEEEEEAEEEVEVEVEEVDERSPKCFSCRWHLIFCDRTRIVSIHGHRKYQKWRNRTSIM